MTAPDRRRPFWYLRRPRQRLRDEIDEEIRAHLDMRVEDLIRAGLDPAEARREATRRFGDVDATRRYCRSQAEYKEADMQRGLLFQDLLQDGRVSARSLLRAPLLALTIVATVGLGIGATTAIFSGIYAALLKPLPYAEPERLVWIYTDTPPFMFRFSVADYLALDAQQTQFARIAGFTDGSMAYSDGVSADVVTGRAVSWTYFGLLGITPVLGRDFGEPDGRPGSPPVVILSHAFWQQRLGARTDVIGHAVRFDGNAYTVVGVLPPLDGPLERRQEFFVAAQFTTPPRRGPFSYWMIGRLAPGVAPEAAASELRAINQRIFPIWRSSYQDDKATWSLMDLKTLLVGDVETMAGLALAAVALVWLIACANASNLLVARVASRRRELAVRAALGASRPRVVRHLLVESAWLALGAALVGAALAWAGVTLLRGVGAAYFPRTQEIALDGIPLAVLAGLAVASALLFGLIPALHAAGSRAQEALHTSDRSGTAGVAVRRWRHVLVGSQFVIATPLLVVAALLLGSLNELRRVDLGFEDRNLITGSVRLPAAQYRESAATATFWSELERRLQALPGMAGVAFTDSPPPSGANNINNFDLEDSPTPPGQSQPTVPFIAVTPDYFRVIGITRLEGRLLEEKDAQTETLETVVVDRAWARRFFPNASAVGRRFKQGGCTECPWTTVVGVVSDVRYVGLDQANEGTVYWAMRPSLTRVVALRAHGDPISLVPSVRRVIRELDASAPLTDVATIDDLIDQSLQQPRALSMLVAGVALVALVLSIVGIYGVMAFYVQQHAKDISVRMALGGSAAAVLRLVVGRGLGVVATGIGIGLLAALGSTRLVASLLFDVRPHDLPTYFAVGASLLLIACIACAVPARRAVAAQPAAVLRHE